MKLCDMIPPGIAAGLLALRSSHNAQTPPDPRALRTHVVCRGAMPTLTPREPEYVSRRVDIPRPPKSSSARACGEARIFGVKSRI